MEGDAIVIRRGNAIVWRGQVMPISSFGRAHVPGLQIAWDAPPEEAIYGLGERFNGLNQAKKRVDLWIADAPGQTDAKESPSYFVSPVLYSSAGYALFAADNPEGLVDLNSTGDGRNAYERGGDHATFYVAAAATLDGLIRQRAAVQGLPRNVPEWALGPWISRNSYEKQSEAEEAIKGHLARGNPIAAIVQEAWKGLSETGDFNHFSKQRWPDVKGYFAFCEQHGIRNVLWQVPVIYGQSPEFIEGQAKGYFVKRPDGQVSLRTEWLAGFANVDFTNPAAVKWWQDMMRDDIRLGVVGFKNDDGEAIKPDDVFSDGRRGWEMHNEYSALYAKALTDLFDQEHVAGVLWARSGSLGLEQHPALWAGDQFANWQQLRSLLPAGLSSGLSGVPFWGHDIGGYIGTPTPELYIRWLQFGALSPLMQYHGQKAKEPWLYGSTADGAYKLLSRLRMNLKPTLAKIAAESCATGLPMMRPMTLDYPDDARFRDEETQYMLGPDLLVAPVLDEGATGRRVRFPTGVWHSALQPISFTGPADVDVPVGLIDAPLFIRDGATLPVQLANDATLGTWTADAPQQDLHFAGDRAVLRNFAAPIIGDPIGRTTRITFETADADIKAQWFWADKPAQVFDAPVTFVQVGKASTGTIDLTPPPATPVLGRRQVYLLASNTAPLSDVPPLKFCGEVDWNSPLALSADIDGSRVVATNGETRNVVTTLSNRSGLPVAVAVTARVVNGDTVTPIQQNVNLRPHGQATANWQLHLNAPGNAVGGTTVNFSAAAGNVHLADGQVTLTYPGRWLIAGPFPATPKSAYGTRFAPEWADSPDTGFITSDGSQVRWQQVPPDAIAKYGGIDFNALFGHHDHAAVYAMTRLMSDRDQPAELRFGSDDTLTVWLNGELVHTVESYRDAAPDQEIIGVHLHKGQNSMLVKVAQDINGWQMIYRVTAPDGLPIAGVTDGFTNDAWSSYAADRAAAHELIDTQPLPWRVFGPIKAEPTETNSWSLPGDEAAVRAASDPADSTYVAVPPARAFGNRIDLNQLLGKSENVVAYVTTEINVDQPTDADIISGSDDGLLLWLNRKLVSNAGRPRAFNAASDRTRVHLNAGRNTLVGRVGQGGGDWLVQIQVVDTTGRLIGSPLKGGLR